MYKVFIENREVNFTNKKVVEEDIAYVKLSKDESVIIDLLPKIRQFKELDIVHVVVENIEFGWREIFSNFKFVRAAGGIVQRGDDFLFIKRNGYWDIPKGKLDKGESFEIAAEREITEECGLSSLVRRDFICSTFHTYLFKNKWHLKETYWFHFEDLGSQQLICQEEEGITEAKWLKRSDFSFIEKQTFSSIRFVIDNFNKLIFENEAIRKACQLLNSEQVVVIPTETVYGLSANALSDKAVSQIFTLKNRPQTNPLIIHCGSIEQVKNYVTDFPDWAQKLADKFWPGPLTILLPKAELIPDKITSGGSRVGVRIPNHPLTLKLLQSLDFPLAAPSANKYGSVSPTCAEHVLLQFGEESPFILEGGPCQIGIESTIVGIEADRIIVYRLGQITPAEIEEVCSQKVFVQNQADEIIVAPGMVKHHYAPKTKLKIVNDNSEILKSEKSGVILFNEDFINGIPLENQYVLSGIHNYEEASKRLYHSFYHLDTLKLDVIFIKPFPNEGVGKSLNDRILRAGMRK